MKTVVTSVCLLLVMISGAVAESPDYSGAITVIEAWLDAQIGYENIPGISAGIVVDQDLIWSGGFGYSDMTRQSETTDSTIYSICSISKLFTSLAILQLRDQGVLDLDDALEEHLPWFEMEQAHPKSGPVTLRSLLTHSSGLPREFECPYWTDPTFPFPPLKKIQEELPGQKTLYPASRNYQYSNLGMSLLGTVVAEKSGMKYEDYVQKKILGPLNLTSTRPFMPQENEGHLARGYSVETRDGERERLAPFQARGIAPAAGFSSTVHDLSRFASWQFHALDTIDDPVLNGNTLHEMQRTQWLDPETGIQRGLGFGIGKLDGKRVVGHSGACPGYFTDLRLIPEKKWAFIVMINCMGVNTYTYIESLYHIFNSWLTEKQEGDLSPDKLSPDKLSPDKLSDYCGRYYDFWGGENIIVSWKGKLANFYLKSPDLSGPSMRLKHVEGDRFRRIRKNGELAEEIRFERDEEGRVIRFWRNGQYVNRMKE